MDLVPGKVSLEMLVAAVVCNSADMAVQLMRLAMNTVIVWLMRLIELHIAMRKENTNKPVLVRLHV